MLDIYKIYNSNNYGDFKVLNYINSRSIEIEFFNTGYKTKVEAVQIRRGEVKDKLSPTVYGVGFMGDGDYKSKVKGKDTKLYQTWVNMLERCYSDKLQVRCPTYIGCSVNQIWHNFQNFAEWFELNYIKGYHLDKDIKINGNKIYSPENCLFVSHEENNIKAQAKYYVFINPDGIEVDVYNLQEFCRGKSLNSSAMCKVAKGKATHHKQWTCSYK